MARIIIEQISQARFDEIVENYPDTTHRDFPIADLPDLVAKACDMDEDVRYGLYYDEYGQSRLGELGDAEVDGEDSDLPPDLD